MKRQVKNNVYWIGYIDWELKHFHGDDYSVEHGSSQNAYLIQEEKTVLIDTVWIPHRFDFIENLEQEIDLHSIDYIIANHGECDHSGALSDLMEKIPDTPIYCTKNAVKSLEGQYGKKGWNFHVVKTGDTLEIGNGKKLIFIEMPMLHWPDSMATYLTEDNILFSNDAFGQHYAIEELFNDKADRCVMMKEAMKYYANILNSYAPMLIRKLKEIESFHLPIDMICPSHGAIWRKEPSQIIEKYAEWANAYQEDQVTIVYDTMWNGTEKIAHKIAEEIAHQSPNTIVKVFNIAKTDKNDIMTEILKSKAIALGSPTVGNDILSSVAGWLAFLKQLKFKGKKAGAFGTWGWSGESVPHLKKYLTEAGFHVIDEEVKVNWTMQEDDLAQVPAFVGSLLK